MSCYQDFDTLYTKNFQLQKDDKLFKLLWDKKVFSYLFFCLNGGLTNNMLTIRDVTDILRKSDDLNKYYKLINEMLSFVVIEKNIIMEEPNINSITNRLQTITQFEYNEDLMHILISNGFLKEIQNVEDNNTYAKFLKYLLEYKQSNDLLSKLYNLKLILVAIFQYLTSITRIDLNDDLTKNLGMIKAFSVIIEPLIKIYSKTDQVPVTINLACKCLNCLTSCEVFGRECISHLLNHNILYVILKYLEYPYEKVLYNNLHLLYNILPSIKEIIDKIIDDNPTLIPKLLSLLKNNFKDSNIILTYCTSRVII